MFAGSISGLVAGLAFTLLLAYACVSGLRARRIPNDLVAMLAVAGLAYSATRAPILHGLARGGGGLLTGLLFWLPFWLLRWLGAGDVKLFAAGAAWLGPWGAVEAAVIGAVIGGMLTVVWLGWQRGVRIAIEKFFVATIHQRVLTGPAVASEDGRRLVPYGLALAAGLVVAGWFPSLLF